MLRYFTTPLAVSRFWFEDDEIWIAPRAWIRTNEVTESLLDRGDEVTLYEVYSPTEELPIDTMFIVNADNGFRVADAAYEESFLENYLAAFR